RTQRQLRRSAVAVWGVVRDPAIPRLVPEVEMRGRMAAALALAAMSAACFAKADGAWLARVPQADHERVNPYAGQPEAIAAGRNLFLNNCAKCHEIGRAAWGGRGE